MYLEDNTIADPVAARAAPGIGSSLVAPNALVYRAISSFQQQTEL
jgi:hypothetical protein